MIMKRGVANAARGNPVATSAASARYANRSIVNVRSYWDLL
jgi:hypothetical protein